jgi:hypothetical protein
MTLEDIKAKRHEIELQVADLQKKLAALDAVSEMFFADQSSAPPMPAAGSLAPPSTTVMGTTIHNAIRLISTQKTLAGPSLLDAIRQSMKEMPEQFNVKWVRRALYRTKPEYTFLTSSLSNALKRMADAGEIKLVMVGSGRRPSRYMKIK